jgi:hypothetical protein
MTLGQIKLALEEGEKLVERRHKHLAISIANAVGASLFGDS